VDIRLPDDVVAFRDEVRAFLDERLPAHIREAVRKQSSVWLEPDLALEWQRILRERGWAAYNWPAEFGGTGWDALKRFVFEKECALAGAPELVAMGLRYVGPVVMEFGTPEQQAAFLPKILTGEHYWAQGFSEPSAGSDLAGVKCKAERRGDHYLVNGTKIWTTHAHFANWLFALVRTSQEDRPHKGISFLLIDMHSPGISVDPIPTIGADHDVNQVFLSDVEVPAENLVGEEGRGWEYAMFLLEFERGGASFASRLWRELAELEAQVQAERPELRHDRLFVHRRARLEIRLIALEMLELRIFSSARAGHGAGREVAVLKLVATELQQDLAKLAVDVAGEDALPYERRRPLTGPNAPPAHAGELNQHLMSRHLNARAATIYGGSSEIQREIIAKQELRLR